MNIKKLRNFNFRWLLTRTLLPLVVLILADVLTGHRALFYSCCELGLSPRKLFESPSKKYDAAELGFGLSGGSVSICAVSKYHVLPKKVLSLDTNNAGIEDNGPEKVDYGVAWSKDESQVALVYCGWYIDYYNFLDSSSYKFRFTRFKKATKQELTEHSQTIIKKLGPNLVIQKRFPFF